MVQYPVFQRCSIVQAVEKTGVQVDAYSTANSGFLTSDHLRTWWLITKKARHPETRGRAFKLMRLNYLASVAGAACGAGAAAGA